MLERRLAAFVDAPALFDECRALGVALGSADRWSDASLHVVMLRVGERALLTLALRKLAALASEEVGKNSTKKARVK